MTAPYLAAAIQMAAGVDKAANLATAVRLVEQAAAAGARLIALPELWNFLGTYEATAAAAETVPGLTSRALAELAARLKVVLVGGSIAERVESSPNVSVFNTSLVFDADGRQLASYRKIHRFDIDLPGAVSVAESEWFSAGEATTTVDTSLGRLGLAICYDLRFPELFRQLATDGAEVIVLPSAFSAATGRDHWEVLLRARAIENQCYLLAANQTGHPSGAFAMHGHSALIDPWGNVVAMADTISGSPARESIIAGPIDLAQLAEIRRRLPALQHRRI